MKTRLFPVSLFLSACALTGCAPVPNAGTPQNAPTAVKKGHIGGTIKGAPTGATFVVTGRQGEFTVDTSVAALSRNFQKVTLADLKEKMFVVVTGNVMSDNHIQAVKVDIIRGPEPPPSHPMKGGLSAGN